MMRLACLTMLVALAAGCAATGGKDPKEAARVNTQLGIEYIGQGQIKMAQGKLERALELDPTYAPTHATLAVLYQRIGRDDEAQKFFEQALALDPHDSYTRNNYGGYLCRRGKTREAMAQFAEVLKDQSYASPEVPLTNAGICARKLPDNKRAEFYFRRALARAPKYPDALAQMAQLSYDRRQALKARAFLQRLEALQPLDREQLELGMKIERALNNEQARARYEQRLRARHPDVFSDSDQDQYD